MNDVIFAVLDSNIWVAGINFDSSISRKILEAGGITIHLNNKKNSDKPKISVEPYYLTSREIVIEIIDTLRKYFDFTDVEAYLWWKIICENTISVNTTSIINLCRDPKDNKLLECASDGDADYLVSNDEDLLVLKDIFTVPIVKIGDFYRVLFEN